MTSRNLKALSDRQLLKCLYRIPAEWIAAEGDMPRAHLYNEVHDRGLLPAGVTFHKLGDWFRDGNIPGIRNRIAWTLTGKRQYLADQALGSASEPRRPGTGAPAPDSGHYRRTPGHLRGRRLGRTYLVPPQDADRRARLGQAQRMF
jgi:hypothetical protein